MDREEYERDLKKRQEEHLRKVESHRMGNHLIGKTVEPFQPCLHNACTQCHGTGVKLDGSACIHMISCPCPKCSPR